MVLVDSSVWIDYLSPRTSRVDQKLEALIHLNNQAVVTGIIFQEVLQGIRSIRSFELTRKLMQQLPFLTPSIDTYSKAAEIFRVLATKGRSCSTVDCFIAALAIENEVSLFTLDATFVDIEKQSSLKLFV